MLYTRGCAFDSKAVKVRRHHVPVRDLRYICRIHPLQFPSLRGGRLLTFWLRRLQPNSSVFTFPQQSWIVSSLRHQNKRCPRAEPCMGTNQTRPEGTDRSSSTRTARDASSLSNRTLSKKPLPTHLVVLFHNKNSQSCSDSISCLYSGLCNNTSVHVFIKMEEIKSNLLVLN